MSAPFRSHKLTRGFTLSDNVKAACGLGSSVANPPGQPSRLRRCVADIASWRVDYRSRDETARFQTQRDCLQLVTLWVLALKGRYLCRRCGSPVCWQN